MTRLTVDSTRDVAPDSADIDGRPVRLMVWYPADPGSKGANLRLGDYFPQTIPDDWTAPYVRALNSRDLAVAERQFESARDLRRLG